MTASSGGFELRGNDDDETRLLVHGQAGYSLAVPGRPRIIKPALDMPRYDVVLALTDAPIEIGLRIDTLTAAETALQPAELIRAFATAYVQSRAAAPDGVELTDMDGKSIANGATEGMRATYPLRDTEGGMEYVGVMLRGAQVLYVTARFTKGVTTPFAWANLRSVLQHHQSWVPGELASTSVWPDAPMLLKPSVKFELSESASREAQAKANEIAELSSEQVERIANLLITSASTDDPPTTPWHPFLNQMTSRQVAGAVPSRVAEILLRDLDAVTSMHDYRGWCWECYVGVGNRAELQLRTN